MPSRDLIHDAVKAALNKDGWTITADPYLIRFEDLTVFADLAAERVVAAEYQGRKIVVEIKSFLGPSMVRDLETALGQYDVYRALLEQCEPERELWLAIPTAVYHDFFTRPAIQMIVERFNVATILVNIDMQEIEGWKN